MIEETTTAPTPTTQRGAILVAGVGNVFFGDDGFGVEVVRRLAQRPLPDPVAAADYGIRGVHLAYDLLDGRFSTLILIDALPVDEPPGTIVVLEVDPSAPAPSADDASGTTQPGTGVPDAHGMDPATVLGLLRTLGAAGPGRVERVYVVGCRPARLDPGMTLSEPVAAALDQAVQTVLGLVGDLVTDTERTGRDRAPTGTDWHPEDKWTSLKQ